MLWVSIFYEVLWVSECVVLVGLDSNVLFFRFIGYLRISKFILVFRLVLRVCLDLIVEFLFFL